MKISQKRPDWAVEVLNVLASKGMTISDLSKATKINYGLLSGMLSGYLPNNYKNKIFEYFERLEKESEPSNEND